MNWNALTRSASEVAKSLPRLRFGLVWIGTISTADSIRSENGGARRPYCARCRCPTLLSTFRPPSYPCFQPCFHPWPSLFHTAVVPCRGFFG